MLVDHPTADLLTILDVGRLPDNPFYRKPGNKNSNDFLNDIKSKYNLRWVEAGKENNEISTGNSMQMVNKIKMLKHRYRNN